MILYCETALGDYEAWEGISRTEPIRLIRAPIRPDGSSPFVVLGGPRRHLTSHLPLHRDLRAQALVVAEDRREGERLPALLVPHRHIALRRVAVDDDPVPLLRVADVVDAHVVVGAPEEGHLIVALAVAEDVPRCRLPHALGDDPVLDADLLAAVRVGPAGDVASSIHVGRAREQELI